MKSPDRSRGNHLSLKDDFYNAKVLLICEVAKESPESERRDKNIKIITIHSFSTNSLKTLSTPSVRNIIR